MKHRKPQLGRRLGSLRTLTGLFLALAGIALALPAQQDAHSKLIVVVQNIRNADYEGDRSKLTVYFEQLTPFVSGTSDPHFLSRVRYWRGFALWRKAINGFNDKAPAAEIQQDLRNAIQEFDAASLADPQFVDASIGSLSCAGFLAYSLMQNDHTSADDPRVKELYVRTGDLWKQARTLAPNHPRLAWVVGPMLWNIPPERGGGQEKAIQSYWNALQEIEQPAFSPSDRMEPAWGRPELLMNLSWSYLNAKDPNLSAAEKSAREALNIVPNWHYVRDILLPQIESAKHKSHGIS